MPRSPTGKMPVPLSTHVLRAVGLTTTPGATLYTIYRRGGRETSRRRLGAAWEVWTDGSVEHGLTMPSAIQCLQFSQAAAKRARAEKSTQLSWRRSATVVFATMLKVFALVAATAGRFELETRIIALVESTSGTSHLY